MRKALAFILCFLSLSAVRAQVAGLSTLSVLDMPSSARTAGVGFDFLSVADDDLLLSLDNPSLISGRIVNRLAVGFVNMFAGSNFGSVAYSCNIEHVGAFAFGLQFGSYGLFEGYDESEQATWDFTAADYIFTLGWGRAINENISVGVNFKPILSQYESYTAIAIAFDLAGSYMSANRLFSATAMARNVGAQILTFDGTAEKLPFELAISGSYKLIDAPFRLLFSLNDLQRWNLCYEDPLNPSSVTDAFTGETTPKRSGVGRVCDNLGRHANIGIEADIKHTVFLRLGYSYRQMVEMRAADALNMSGFSFGVGVKVKSFEFCYARNNYHLGQAPNFISLTMDIDRFFR